ncbi:MAG: hypothetical protein ACRDG5_06400, partial [Anaerolineales bacterium]
MPSRAAPGRRAPRGLVLASLAAVLFLNVPFAFILLYAFTTDDSTFSFPPPGLTLGDFVVPYSLGNSSYFIGQAV